MKTEFSESSYAFSVTHELASGILGNATAAPVVPTLQAEGSSGGGYDVKIPLNPVALFLQYKVPNVLKRSSHLRPIDFPVPYYRIHLRTNSPNQHRLLIELEAKDNLVFYVAPRFHEACELDRLFVERKVALNSIYIRPSDVGSLDEKNHHIAYCNQPRAWVHSEPQLIEQKYITEKTFLKIKSRVQKAPEQNPKAFMVNLSQKLVTTVNRLALYDSGDTFDRVRTRHDVESDEEYERIPDKPFIPLEYGTRSFDELARIAQAYLGVQLFVLGSEFTAEKGEQ